MPYYFSLHTDKIYKHNNMSIKVHMMGVEGNCIARNTIAPIRSNTYQEMRIYVGWLNAHKF